jgi:ribonuclease G
MQAAFVDVGLNRDAFLYVREAGGILDEFSEIFAPIDGDGSAPDLGESTIDALLQPGQEALVQIVKDPLGSKGARLTTYISLPGRFLVYLPTTSQLGVSRRITDETERERLREIISTIDQPGGWIVRTAGENQQAEDLEADGRALSTLWGRVQEAAENTPAPGLIHQELSPVLRTIRDMFTRTIDECWIDDEEAFREVLDFLERSDPTLVSRVKLFRHSRDLMVAHGIDRELEKALRPKIWLKSGGYLVVNQTEALVAIDINTGKFVGSTDLEDTAFQINQEAVREIVRQLRLRDLGGIIVIDFIDMEIQEHREALFSTLEAELQLDPARTQLVPMSELGLIQLTRKRTRPSLDRTLSRPCPHCHGTGRIKSLPTICLEIRRQLLDLSQTNQPEQISLMVHPEVSHYLQGPFRDLLRELEEVHGLEIILRENPLFHQEQYEMD